MSLPKRPPLNQPIPNADIPNVPEQYIVKAPYWDAVVSGNLVVSEDGTLTLPPETEGGDSNTEVLSAYWSMPLGEGLTVNEQGFLVPSVSPYIYCTPAYPELPPSDPPYGCDTEVNTAGVTDFTDAWNGCNLTDPLPCIDTSSGQNFYYAFYGNNWDTFPSLDVSQGTYFAFAWGYNFNLETFPNLNISSGENFEGAWYDCDSLTTFPLLDFSSAVVLGDRDNFNYGAWENCDNLVSFPAINTSNVEKFSWTWGSCPSLESFPLIDTSKGTMFYSTWNSCTSLTSFPPLDVSSGTTFSGAWTNCSSLTSFPLLDVSSGEDFSSTWAYCSSLTTFPAGMFNSCSATNFTNAWKNCALSQTSVNNILVSLDTAGQSNGIVTLDGGTSSAPGPTGLAAKASLEAKGWSVSTN